MASPAGTVLAMQKLKSADASQQPNLKIEKDKEGVANLKQAIKGHIEEKMKAKKGHGHREKSVSFKKVFDKMGKGLAK